MITDARALRTQFVPQELQHREGAIQQLSTALNPIIHEEPAADAFISGPPGAGKTTTAKYVAEQLEQETWGYRWGYVNCLSRGSRAQVLWKLARDAGVGTDLRVEGHDPAVFLERLAGMDKQFVAIIDEVNVLHEPMTLVDLYSLPHVSVILVCVDEDTFYANADSRVMSRLRGAVKVYLEHYADSQLVDILRKRVEHGLVTGVVQEQQIRQIAERAGGDARHAIILLRMAIMRAREAGQSTVTSQNVRAVTDAAREEIEQRYLSSLGTDMRLLFQLVRDAGPIGAPELRRRYERRAGDPVAASTRGKYLRQLQEMDLIESLGEGKGTTYDVVRRAVPAMRS